MQFLQNFGKIQITECLLLIQWRIFLIKVSFWRIYQNFDRILLLNQLGTVFFSFCVCLKITSIGDKIIILKFSIHYQIAIKYIFFYLV